MQSFDPVTREGVAITNLFGLELVITALLLALVFGWLIVAVVRFRARPGVPTDPRQVQGNRRLELIWTSAPVLTLAIIAVLMIQTMRSVDAAPANRLPVRIIGHQWWWEIVYPNGQAITANEIH